MGLRSAAIAARTSGLGSGRRCLNGYSAHYRWQGPRHFLAPFPYHHLVSFATPLRLRSAPPMQGHVRGANPIGAPLERGKGRSRRERIHFALKDDSRVLGLRVLLHHTLGWPGVMRVTQDSQHGPRIAESRGPRVVTQSFAVGRTSSPECFRVLGVRSAHEIASLTTIREVWATRG